MASRAFMCIFHNKHLAYTLALRPRRTDILVHDWKFVAGLGLNGGIAQGVKGMCLGCVPDLPQSLMSQLLVSRFLPWHFLITCFSSRITSLSSPPSLRVFSIPFSIHVFVSCSCVPIPLFPVQKNRQHINPTLSPVFFTL